MKTIIDNLKILLDKLNKNKIAEYAANCAYFTILAFIPIIILILTITKYVGIEEETLFLLFYELIPSNILNDAVLEIVKEVYSKSIGTITISAIFILWSAGNGFFALCKGLSAAYEVEDEKKAIKFRIRAMISTIIFIILVVFTLLLLVFGNGINNILQEKFNFFSVIINVILNAKIIISIIVLSIIFMIMYKLVPKHNYSLKKQVPGAIFASIACTIISIFYSIYVDIFTGFSVMYGSLTTIVLAMMWVYACMYSILLGGIINKLLIDMFWNGAKTNQKGISNLLTTHLKFFTWSK